MIFTALFYFRTATGNLEETHETMTATSLTAARRAARDLAVWRGWRLVEVWSP